nr:MAG TPA: hypothetical protein [Caudoviricetes sp.]
MDFKKIKDMADLAIRAIGILSKNNGSSNYNTIMPFYTKEEIEAIYATKDPEVIKEYFEERLRHMRNFNNQIQYEQESKWKKDSDAYKAELIKEGIRIGTMAVIGLAVVFGVKYIEHYFERN